MYQRFTRRFNRFNLFNVCLIMALAATMTACGGGGGGTTSTGTVSALTLPDRIQLTSVDESSGSARPASSMRGLFARSMARGAYSDEGTDYTNAVKRSWVDDTDALNMINTILGVCSETSYANFINQGPYLALVRDSKESEQSQGGNSTTSTTTEELMEIIVDVSRASNSAPMIIKVWLFVNGPEDMPMLVRGYFTVSQGVSSEYPYGVMEAHFKGNSVDGEGTIGIEVMQMALGVSAENGSVVLENIDDEGITGMWEGHRKVRVVANADVTQGNAYVYALESQCDDVGCDLPDNPTIMQIAFDPNYFKETVGDTSTVYAKDQFSRRIFRYQLFDAATGAKITRNSGFPIQTADGRHGYVGYYGLWMNNNATLANGTQVTDMDGNTYTVFKSAGKLTKHTRDSMLLSALNGVEMSKYTCDDLGCTDLIVAWNSTSQQFVTLGYRNQSNGQLVFDTTGLPATVTFQEWEGAWCEPLKAYLNLGSLYFNPDTNAPMVPTNNSMVYYHAEQTIDPGTATDLTLYTWSFTLDMPITQTIINNAGPAENAYWSSQSEKTFQFDASAMMLYDATGTYPATLPDSATFPQGSNLQWGYHIGPLTTTQYTIDNNWQAHNAETYYTWNTGTDQWNQFVTVVDSNGNFVSFDPPISFSYTHTTGNDANADDAFNDKTFRIEYDGFSVNIPWYFDNTIDEWVPQINIADGTLMGPGNIYVIKGVEQALIMSSVDDPGTLTYTEVGEPGLTYDATKTALVGDVPTGVELKVIKGEVIE